MRSRLLNVGFDIHKYKYKYFISHFLIHDSRKKKIFIWLVTVMSVHQTGPRCRRIPYQQNTHMFSSRHVPLLLTHNALGLGLHRQPSYNHYSNNKVQCVCFIYGTERQSGSLNLQTKFCSKQAWSICHCVT